MNMALSGIILLVLAVSTRALAENFQGLGLTLLEGGSGANALDKRADPVNGTIVTYTLPFCDKDTSNLAGGGRTWPIAPDTCMKVSTSTSFEILEVPKCANGTQALLARYEGRDCNYGEVTFSGGLVEVKDKDIGTCQTVMPKNYTVDETHASIASFGFFCDGRTTPRPEGDDGPKAKKGSVSMNLCPIHGNPSRGAPTWEHPQPDECVVSLSGWQARIYKPATCADGNQARLAKWLNNRFCEGHYDEIVDITPDMIETCVPISEDHHGSFTFYCTGAGEGWAILRQQSALLLIVSWLSIFLGAKLL